MAKNKNGVILNISSDLGIIAPNQDIYIKTNFIKPVTYSVVKHGIIGLTKYTASYWAKKIYDVTQLLLGVFLTIKIDHLLKK